MRKIIDDRGRLFGIVSFIDVFVLAVVVVIAVAVFTKFNVHDNPLTTPNTVSVSYTVKIPAIRDTTAELIYIGDNLYTDAGTFIGTIRGIAIEDATSLEPLVDGTNVLGRIHERYDVTLTVEAQTSFSDGRYFASRVFELNVNSEQRMQTKYNLFTGIITSLTPG
jgi:hypothetical protein